MGYYAFKVCYWIYSFLATGVYLYFVIEFLEADLKDLAHSEYIDIHQFHLVYASVCISAVLGCFTCLRIILNLIRIYCPCLCLGTRSTEDRLTAGTKLLLLFIIMVPIYTIAILATIFVWSWKEKFDANGDSVYLAKKSLGLFCTIIISITLSTLLCIYGIFGYFYANIPLEKMMEWVYQICEVTRGDRRHQYDGGLQ